MAMHDELTQRFGPQVVLSVLMAWSKLQESLEIPIVSDIIIFMSLQLISL